ncbi:MAG: hypothetical protein ACLTSL_06105 [Odoribacter splanchnicus]
MKFGFLDNSRIFVLNLAKDSGHIISDSNTTIWVAIIYRYSELFNSFRGCLIYIDGVLWRDKHSGIVSVPFFINRKFRHEMPKNAKFANNAQGVDYARTSPRKREIPSLSLKRQLKHLKAMIRTERNHKLRAYSFILDNSIFDCYSHYCMTTLPDSIPDEFIEIMDIMSLKTDPTLLKQGGIQ